MAALQEIKSRMNSVDVTRKITKAMQLVATAKLRRAKSNLDGVQDYYHSVFDAFQNLLGSIKDFSVIAPKNPTKSSLYIMITSDLGLCGSYNSSVYKLFKNEAAASDQLIVIGTKGTTEFRKDKRKIMQFEQVGDNPDYLIASEISKKAVAMFNAGEVDAVKIIHTEYVNSVTFNSVITTALPVSSDKDSKNKTTVQTEFEPDAETVVRNALPLYISAILYGSMIESKVSEMTSRRTAMENATDNADELINHLHIQYNRARQAAITQEISEIIAGAETD